VKDAAQVLDVTEAWLAKKAKQRIIPVRLIGGRYAWTEEDLAAIVDASLQGPAAPAGPKPRKPRTKTPPTGSGSAPVLTARKRRR
jgi:hypothetical protein